MFNSVIINLPGAINAPGLDRLVETCRREGIDLLVDAERVILSAPVGNVLRGVDEHTHGIPFEVDDPEDLAATVTLANVIATDGLYPCDGECGFCAQVQDEIAREHALSNARAEAVA